MRILKSKDLEEQLEELKLKNEIANQEEEIARHKALEAEMKQKYGSNWKKIIGYKRKEGQGLMESLSQARFTIRDESGKLG